MDEELIPCYCVLNYQSKLGVDKRHSYEFWFTSSIIRIIADKPFGRGDIAKIKNITKQSETEWRINIDVLGDPKIEKIPREVFSQGEVPTLLFVTPKIYLNDHSEYHAFGSDNVKILLNCSATLDGNKSYTIAALVKGKQAKIYAADKFTGDRIEWLISDTQ